MTSDDVRRVLSRLTNAYAKRLPDGTYAIWLEELAELDFPPAWAACRDLTKTNKFFPSIAEFAAEYVLHVDAQARPKTHTDCPHCDGGFTLTDHATNTVKPCRHCNPALFTAWANGKTPKTRHQPTTALFTPGAGTTERPEPTWADHARTVILEMQHVLDEARRNRTRPLLPAPSTPTPQEPP